MCAAPASIRPPVLHIGVSAILAVWDCCVILRFSMGQRGEVEYRGGIFWETLFLETPFTNVACCTQGFCASRRRPTGPSASILKNGKLLDIVDEVRCLKYFQMSVHIKICVYIYIFRNMYFEIYVYIYRYHICMYIHICMHVCMHICMYVCVYVCMYEFMYVSIYIYMDLCIYIHMYIYTHTYGDG